MSVIEMTATIFQALQSSCWGSLV